jgi:hypothetical protein
MITIAKTAVDTVRAADSPRDLHDSLAAAMRLEHSTVPLYLSAYFSLRPGTNLDVARTLRSIVIEEMMHFTIVANILNAIGGTPLIDDPTTVPTFPGPLPMGVETGLNVSATPMSLPQCKVFMQIEEPDDPIGLPPDPTDPTTIGDFYHAIATKITELGDAAFGCPSGPQVVSPSFPSDRLFAVTDAASAVRAITVIVEQGEGTSTRPFIEPGQTELAHYYRFGEILNGNRFVTDPTAAEGFSYSGDPVVLDASPTGIYPMVADATLDRYRGDGTSLRLATRFCAAYRHLLTRLQKTFTGAPDALAAAFGLMYEMRIAALAMIETPDPNDPAHCLTPPWIYLP